MPTSPPTAKVSSPSVTTSAQVLPLDTPIVPTATQQLQLGRPQPGMPGLPPGPESEVPAVQEITIQIEPPPAERLFKLESERAWRERLRQEAHNRGQQITFPDEPILSTDRFPGRHWPRMTMWVEPMYVGFNRLYFHQINFERYGWDLGPVSTLLSAATFFKDLVMFPYHACTDPFRDYEYNRGWCLPGDAVPLMLYPEPISATGLLGEAAAVVLVLVTFP